MSHITFFLVLVLNLQMTWCPFTWTKPGFFIFQELRSSNKDDQILVHRNGRGHSSYRSRWSRDHPLICSNWIFWPKNGDFMSSNQSNDYSEVYYEIQKVKFFEDASGLFANINWKGWWEKRVGMENWGDLCPPFGWFLEWPLKPEWYRTGNALSLFLPGGINQIIRVWGWHLWLK